MTTKPEALRLADALMETDPYPLDIKQAARELRRLHELLEAEQALLQRVIYPEQQRLRAQHDKMLKVLKFVATLDQGCGGNVSEAEAWRVAQNIARAAIAMVQGQ